MKQPGREDSFWRRVRTFADKHICLFTWILCLLTSPVALLVLMPSILIATAAPITAPIRIQMAPSLTFLDKTGNVIGHQGPLAGQYVSLGQMPAYLPKAFIAMEDRRFYFHHGVDFLGMSRAAYTDVRAGRVMAGGSTITQQTAKLLFTTGSRTLSRKLHELMYAAALEKSFSKDQILETYLNRIFLGEGAFGVDSAARSYFGVPASRIDLSQAAMLAGLTRAPTTFSPRRHLDLAQKRASMVLDKMVETGAITADQARVARAHPAEIIPAPRDDHSYVLDAAVSEVQELVTQTGLTARALVVRTTIDSAIQAHAEDVIRRTVARLGPKQGFSQAALVLMTPDGSISSMVGGVDYSSSVFNRVTQARRQPGSAFKPFVYLAALEHGISPWEWRDDEPVDIAGYQPANYENTSYGRVRLIDALARSINTIAVTLAQEVGVANVSSVAKRLGITSALHNNASLALGTDEVTPLELTATYAAFVNGGKSAVPHLVSEIRDADGRTVFRRQETTQRPVISDEIRRDMVAMLCAVIESGTGTAARLPGRDAGGKTGTSQEYRDAWFVGFTAGHVAGVWIGNDDNHRMRKVTGGTVPAQLWKSVMLAAEAGTPASALERSPGPPVGAEPEEVAVTAYTDDWPGAPTIDDASPGPRATASAMRAVVAESVPATADTVEQGRAPPLVPPPAPPPAAVATDGDFGRASQGSKSLPQPAARRQSTVPLPTTQSTGALPDTQGHTSGPKGPNPAGP